MEIRKSRQRQKMGKICKNFIKNLQKFAKNDTFPKFANFAKIAKKIEKKKNFLKKK